MSKRVVDNGDHIDDCEYCGHPRREHFDDECETCNVAGGECEAEGEDEA
jgi:hypothetical protein